MKEMLIKADSKCIKSIKENTGCSMCSGHGRCEQYGSALMHMKKQDKVYKEGN
jgi:hypothetical protein